MWVERDLMNYIKANPALQNIKLATIKLLINSTVSTKGAQFASYNLKKSYLETTL